MLKQRRAELAKDIHQRVELGGWPYGARGKAGGESGKKKNQNEEFGGWRKGILTGGLMGLQAPQRLARRAVSYKLAMPLDLDVSRASLHSWRPRKSSDVVFPNVCHVKVTHRSGCGWGLAR